MARPRVTVLVVSLWPAASRLMRCLDSVIADPLSPALQVSVLLNGAPGTASALQDRYPMASIMQVPVNLGFAGGCNLLAREANTEYLAFINDDSIATAGWLKALMRRADQSPECGAVGSRILFTDGQLQEAGCLVWQDATTTPVGRGCSVDRYNAVREVHYCSANGLLVRSSAWLECGGFDDEYYPAYYEDVDLCFALRHHHNRSVIYEPRSVIFHEGSASTTVDLRSFLIHKNKRYFALKWERELSSYANPRSSLSQAIAHAAKAKGHVLVIDDRAPDPAVGSGFGRMQDLALDLRALDYAVTFLFTAERPSVEHPLCSSGVELLPISCLNDVVTDIPLSAALISRPHNYLKHARNIRRYQPGVPIIYDAEALFHVRMSREVTMASTRRATFDAKRQAKAMAALERRIARDADMIVTTSVQEREVFRQFGARQICLSLPVNRAIALTTAPFEKRSIVFFAAGWLAGKNSPNLSSLVWLTESVLPKVWNQVPSARLVVTGWNAPAEARKYESERITFTERIDDLWALYNSAIACVSPVFVGAGTKVKTVEALQYGVPVVSTAVGAEGLDDYAGQAVIRADDANSFATGLIDIMTNPAEWNKWRTRTVEAGRHLLSTAPRWAEIISGVVDQEKF